MAKEIIDNLDAALNETITLLESFTEEELNKVPFEGSWTAAQVGRHLYKSEAGTDELFSAPSVPANRQPDQKAKEFKDLMQNDSIKMESPGFIVPENKEYDKQELLQSLKEVKTTVLNVCKATDLETLPPLQEGHPLKGSTKLELVYFMTYHTERHNRQIEKIKNIIQ